MAKSSSSRQRRSVSAVLAAASSHPPKTLADFAAPRGMRLLTRTRQFCEWQDERRGHGTWPFARTLVAPPRDRAAVVDDRGHGISGINMSSQDALSLSSHPSVRAAAHAAIEEFGPHSASTPVMLGNTSLSKRLEVKVAEHLSMQECLLFSSGWAAAFGAVSGLVSAHDHVVLDDLVHSGLSQGATVATRNVSRFEHLSVASLEERLRGIRMTSPNVGILVATQALFATDSLTSDVRGLLDACQQYGATLIVDVALDIGAMGPDGRGVLGILELANEVDVVVGSFAPSLCGTGGFIVTGSRPAAEFLKYNTSCYREATGMSPVQAAVALEALRIARSSEGEERRDALRAAGRTVREAAERHGLDAAGQLSPIVPIRVHDELVARTASRLITERGVLVDLVEYPSSAAGDAHFRLHLMSDHDPLDLEDAVRITAEAINDARAHCGASPR